MSFAIKENRNDFAPADYVRNMVCRIFICSKSATVLMLELCRKLLWFSLAVLIKNDSLSVLSFNKQ